MLRKQVDRCSLLLKLDTLMTRAHILRLGAAGPAKRPRSSRNTTISKAHRLSESTMDRLLDVLGRHERWYLREPRAYRRPDDSKSSTHK